MATMDQAGSRLLCNLGRAVAPTRAVLAVLATHFIWPFRSLVFDQHGKIHNVTWHSNQDSGVFIGAALPALCFGVRGCAVTSMHVGLNLSHPAVGATIDQMSLAIVSTAWAHCAKRGKGTVAHRRANEHSAD